jgi:hypothetical protein
MMLSLFKSLRTLDRDVPLVHTYDINCQFSVKIWERFETLPEDLKRTATPRNEWTFLIPKMHLMGHLLLCQAMYSLNHHHGAGRTCGECIERMWALMNGISLSTREMRAGRRSDWIDFHMGHHNYIKQCSIGKHSFSFSLRFILTPTSRRYSLPEPDGGSAHGCRASCRVCTP